jgi:hypothetical protein
MGKFVNDAEQQPKQQQARNEDSHKMMKLLAL